MKLLMIRRPVKTPFVEVHLVSDVVSARHTCLGLCTCEIFSRFLSHWPGIALPVDDGGHIKVALLTCIASELEVRVSGEITVAILAQRLAVKILLRLQNDPLICVATLLPLGMASIVHISKQTNLKALESTIRVLDYACLFIQRRISPFSVAY